MTTLCLCDCNDADLAQLNLHRGAGFGGPPADWPGQKRSAIHPPALSNRTFAVQGARSPIVAVAGCTISVSDHQARPA